MMKIIFSYGFVLPLLDIYIVTINEGPQSKPEHKLQAGLEYFDIKLDYMGASICMIQLSKADINLNDEWIIAASSGNTMPNTPTDTPIATNRWVTDTIYTFMSFMTVCLKFVQMSEC